jgi:hypothetical protein
MLERLAPVAAALLVACVGGVDEPGGGGPVESTPVPPIVETVDGTPVATMATTQTTATAGGLPDGEYRLRVEAIDDLGRVEDGDRSLVQLVGENRLVPSASSSNPRWS